MGLGTRLLLFIWPALAGVAEGGVAEGPRLVRVAVLETRKPGAEILSIQTPTRRGVLTHSEDGAVELFDFSDPEMPRSLALFDLALDGREELTSVAVHPTHPWFLASIKSADPATPGRLQVHALDDGEPLAAFPTGFGPDCVAIAPDGLHALVANEGEELVEADGERTSPPGSLTWVALAADPRAFRVRQLPIPTVEAEGSVTASDERFLEREVDGDEVLVPLSKNTPDLVEPEVVAFDPTGKLALCTLQENNAACLWNVPEARLIRIFGLGLTTHAADLTDDDRYRANELLTALREPDGCAFLPGGRYFVTADEGDTEPGPAKAEPGKPVGGGRTLSVFETGSGECLGDTGDQLDRWAAAAGVYPDGRSGKKGSEPEMVVAFELRGRPYAAVTLERAGAVALVDCSTPEAPLVVSLAAVGPEEDAGDFGPEGICHLHDAASDRHYLYTANEENGTLTVLRVDP